jgi:hypothetical protein
MYDPPNDTTIDMTKMEMNNKVGKFIWKGSSEKRSAWRVRVMATTVPIMNPKKTDAMITAMAS